MDNGEKSGRRSLPSWTSSNENEDKYSGQKQVDGSSIDKAHNQKKSMQRGNNRHGEATENKHFSRLLDGVIFVLSGFVNPERSTLRSQALDMGAEYRANWTSECTLLICAFPNTPKFRQVEADCGTIVSKEWIAECYAQKKLVEIDRYLMHVGKPWRKIHGIPVCKGEEGEDLDLKASKKHGKRPLEDTDDSSASKGEIYKSRIKHPSPSEVKEWAAIDLSATISWLEHQEERPEPDEIKKIAAEGIITCLQDAIEALDHNQDIQTVAEQWMFIPRVVKEVSELDSESGAGSLTKQKLSSLALDWKHVYEAEFTMSKKLKDSSVTCNYGDPKIVVDNEGFDSDSTIEMTEEEIDLAYRGFLH